MARRLLRLARLASAGLDHGTNDHVGHDFFVVEDVLVISVEHLCLRLTHVACFLQGCNYVFASVLQLVDVLVQMSEHDERFLHRIGVLMQEVFERSAIELRRRGGILRFDDLLDLFGSQCDVHGDVMCRLLGLDRIGFAMVSGDLVDEQARLTVSETQLDFMRCGCP